MNTVAKAGACFVAAHQISLYRQESKNYQDNLRKLTDHVIHLPEDKKIWGFHGGEMPLTPKPGTHLFLSRDPGLAVAYAGRYVNSSVAIVMIAADAKPNAAHANISTTSDGFRSLNGFRVDNPTLPVDVRIYSGESISVAVDRFPEHQVEIQEIPVQPINPNALLYRAVTVVHQLLT